MATNTACALQERERNRDWLTALLPVFLIGFVYYGWWVPAMALTGCGAYLAVAGLTDRWQWVHPQVEAGLVTGLLVIFCLPVTTPLWAVALACGVAALLTAGVDKLGQRWHWVSAPVCPALVGYLLLRWVFPAQVGEFPTPVQFASLDSVSGATPMVALWDGSARETATRLFTGAHAGAIGEGCGAVLLLAAAYLLLRRRLRLIAPGAMLATVSLLSWLIWGAPLYGLLTGGVLLAALLLADRAYAPAGYLAQAVVGVLAGGVIVLVRGVSHTDGSAVAVLIACLVGCAYPALAGMVTRRFGAGAKNFAKTEKKG